MGTCLFITLLIYDAIQIANYIFQYLKEYAKSLQSYLTLCSPTDYSPPGSSVHGILQAKILGWVAFPSPGDLPNPGTELASLTSPALAEGSFITRATWEAL